MASQEISYNGCVALGLGGESYEKGSAVTMQVKWFCVYNVSVTI